MSSEIEREINRLWRAWRTVHEMVRDRGYRISEEEIEISYEEFKQKYIMDAGGSPSRALLTFSALPSEEMITKLTPLPTASEPDPQTKAGTIYCEFAKEETIGVKQILVFMQQVAASNHSTGIFITRHALSGPALKATLSNVSFKVEAFREQDLLINITKHVLVPKHILLSAGEKKALLERYRLKETQLPRIQQSDAMARYLGLRRGDVVKIIRRSVTAGRYASYRWCV